MSILENDDEAPHAGSEAGEPSGVEAAGIRAGEGATPPIPLATSPAASSQRAGYLAS